LRIGTSLAPPRLRAAALAPEPAMTSTQHAGLPFHGSDVIGAHRHGYHLRRDELGPCGHFAPSVLTGVLQEAAIDGSAARGYPLEYYLRERGFWVIRRITFRHDRPLRYGDSLEVTTWVSRVGKTSPTREFRLDSASRGGTIGRARTHWVYVDAATGQPKAIPDDLREAFAPTGETQEELLTVPEQPLDGRRCIAEERTVEPGDVDAAGHLKCCRYLAWLEDLLARACVAAGAAPGTTSLASFDLQLLSPAGCGDRVRLIAQPDVVWKVEMSARDGQMIARAALWPRTPDAARGTFADVSAALVERLRSAASPGARSADP
jgi:acyl-CoA thioesterase FadM